MPVMLPCEDVLKPVDIYVDGAGHPCLCLGIDDDVAAWGISLVDGTWPRRHKLSESITLKLTLREAFQAKIEGMQNLKVEGNSKPTGVTPFDYYYADKIGSDFEDKENELAAGGFHEDCAYHPCLTMGVDTDDDNIWGISLIDGTWPRCCSLRMCGVVPLTLDQAWLWKMRGPDYPTEELEEVRPWWTHESEKSYDRIKHQVGSEVSGQQIFEWRKALGCPDGE